MFLNVSNSKIESREYPCYGMLNSRNLKNAQYCLKIMLVDSANDSLSLLIALPISADNLR